MTNDELEDRVKGLESLVLRLIQHLDLAGSLPAEIREQMVDSLIDVATGDKRAEFHARRLQEAIEGSGSSTMADLGARTRARQQALRDLYGSED